MNGHSLLIVIKPRAAPAACPWPKFVPNLLAQCAFVIELGELFFGLEHAGWEPIYSDYKNIHDGSFYKSAYEENEGTGAEENLGDPFGGAGGIFGLETGKQGGDVVRLQERGQKDSIVNIIITFHDMP